MKKVTLKRTVALLLVVMMLAALTACSGNSVAGKWKYELDFNKYIDKISSSALDGAEAARQEIFKEFTKLFDGVSIDIYIEFNDDGTYSTYTDSDSAKAAEEKIKESMKTALPKVYAAMGIDFDAYLKQSDMTLEKAVESALESFDFSELQAAGSKGKYRYDNGKIYVGEDEVDESKYLTVELKDNKLTVTDVAGDAAGFEKYKEFLFPMEFTKC